MKYFAHSQREFVYKYVVMRSDVDQFQHMSFANYLRLMFLATDALILGVHEYGLLMNNSRLITSKSNMQFKSQTVFGDNILIKVNSSNLQKDHFSLLFTYIIEESGTLVALGKQSLYFASLNTRTPIPTPSEITPLLESISVNERNLLYRY
ncbi:MAG: hypothetical protein COV74_00310 [Candidatus Omnitrophica bacterium CG11_big_fil_rev_8_21_14_0_20_45_26]|uniref:Thioesterase n=1 Tax=Candidatus Abzuiibacterium crystallinum TaxID=1974748 RepID=A0A2H0LT01_9BACT|nr:MAG: hypothetical protein COV74_00310 [Candidatus Omnitrophica bacterium CG11_big_fil_rev_8_21_14_0_20_45_26]PIW64619.1 MAG: hypothetical protein COW12_05470 [Candidatus Omnitrophica bacterium CG12_big_fil_rev_8_21_14_0_65_45_16]